MLLTKRKRFLSDLAQGLIDMKTLGANEFRVLLHTAAPGTADFASGLLNEVANGNGYATGGKTVLNPTYSDAALPIVVDCDDVVWTNSSITATHASLIYYTGDMATSWVIATVDFQGSQQSINASFSYKTPDGLWSLA